MYMGNNEKWYHVVRLETLFDMVLLIQHQLYVYKADSRLLLSTIIVGVREFITSLVGFLDSLVFASGLSVFVWLYASTCTVCIIELYNIIGLSVSALLV